MVLDCENKLSHFSSLSYAKFKKDECPEEYLNILTTKKYDDLINSCDKKCSHHGLIFEDYKKLENKSVKEEEFQNKEVAIEVVKKSIEDYQTKFG